MPRRPWARPRWVRSRPGRYDWAMDDDHAVVARVLKEAFPYPSQIPANLLFQIYARPHPGMDEQIVAEAEGVRQPGQEAYMFARHLRDKSIHDGCRTCLEGPTRAHAIAFGALGTAISQPALNEILVAAQHVQEEFLVIPLEEH